MLVFDTDIEEEGVEGGKAFSCGVAFATVRPAPGGLLIVLEVDPAVLDDTRGRCRTATAVDPDAAEVRIEDSDPGVRGAVVPWPRGLTACAEQPSLSAS
jgi:hypothetical protein